MRPLAYNHLGDIVFVSESGSRLLGRSAQSAVPETAPSPLSLRILPEDPESLWLCALACALQPESNPVAAGAFFKLCVEHLDPALHSALAQTFAPLLLIAFFRLNLPALDGRKGVPELERIHHLFFARGYDKPAKQLPLPLRAYASPIAWATFRLALSESGKVALKLPFDDFNPFEGLPARIFLPQPTARTPWPAHPHSFLLPSNVSHGEHGDLIPELASASTSMDPFDSTLWAPFSAWGFAAPVNLIELVARLQASHASLDAAQDRKTYEPLTQLRPSASLIPAGFHAAHEKLRHAIRQTTPDWDEFVSVGLGIPAHQLAVMLSAEQIDACGLALRAFSDRQAFILADETGLGKGRTLACMARAFLQTGRKVFFITEKRNLFSDFWRDMKAVGADQLISEPFLLHSKGRIFDPTGSILFTAKSPKLYQQTLRSGQSQSLLVMSTYSQFNRDLKKSDRWTFALNFAQDALLILDESHVAAGQSQTRTNIQALIDASSRCLFSSATFAKHEEALPLYQRAIPLSSPELSLLLDRMQSDPSHGLAQSFSQGLAAAGALVRREHLIESHLGSTLIELSAERSASAVTQRDALAHSLDRLFLLSEAIETAKLARGLDFEPAWLKLGAPLSRLCRQFNLLSKIDQAVDLARDLIAEGKKPVFAIESTFESFLLALSSRSLNDLNDDADLEFSDDDSEPASAQQPVQASFQDLFRLAVETLAPAPLLAMLPDPSVQDALRALELSIQALPSILASPIDLLIAQLQSHGISCGEISGRSHFLRIDPSGDRFISPLSLSPREKLIQEFNSGTLDALLITRAGSSGISLHASAEFIDQRPRAFIELEIATNPSQRLQFLGRVRRTGQTSAPSYYVLLSGAPFERRLLERAIWKMNKLSGLTSGGASLSAGSLDMLQLLLSPTGDRLTNEWLVSQPQVAKRLGLDLWKLSSLESSTEKTLKRLPLLPAPQQESFFQFLLAGLEIDKPRFLRAAQGFWQASGAVLTRRKPFWGQLSLRPDSPPPEEFDPRLFLEEWVAQPRGSAFGEDRLQSLVASASARFELRFASGLVSVLQKAARSRSQLISHPLTHGSWGNLQQASSHLRPGARIRFTDPSSHRAIDGLVLDVIPPEDDWLLYPSQWGIEIAIPNESDSFVLSLGSFFSDPHAYLDSSAPPRSSWGKRSDRPLHFSTVSGHCVYAQWWAMHMRSHRQHFYDAFHERRSALLLPFSVGGFDALLALPQPLLDAKHALQLLQHDPRLSLSNSAFDTPSAQIQVSEGGWLLTLSRSQHELWVDFPLDRRLGPRLRQSDSQWIYRRILSKDIHAVMGMLYAKGCVFFAPSSRQGWYRQSLEALLLARRGSSGRAKKRPARR